MGANVVEKVHAGVTILLPTGKSNAAMANKQADDPEFTNTPYFLPNLLAISFSNLIDLGPCPPNQPERRVFSTAFISSYPYDSNLYGAYQIFFILYNLNVLYDSLSLSFSLSHLAATWVSISIHS